MSNINSSFHEVYSIYYKIIYRLISDFLICKMTDEDSVISGEELDELLATYEEEFRFKLPEMFSDALKNSFVSSSNELDEASEGNIHLLNSTHLGYYYPFCEMPYINPTKLEMVWLMNVIYDPKLKLFINECTLDKLKKTLSCSEADLPLKIINRVIEDSTNIDKIKRYKNLAYEAITQGKWLKAKYQTVSKEFISSVTEPLCLEYSVRDDRFYLIHYGHNDARLIKSRLDNYIEITIVEPEGDSYKKKNDGAYDRKLSNTGAAQSVKLLIKDEKTAVERAVLTFSEYPHRIAMEQDLFELSIEYMEYEKDVIIRKILSLGPAVKIIEPCEMVMRLKDICEKALKKY